MANLLELTRQGDPGTIVDESQLDKIQLQNPQQLYELWERQHWSAHAIDLSRDVDDWLAVPDDEREYMLWSLSSFFIGEERVTTQFSGLVMAYEDQSEEAYLTTQQVDEARHTQFFARYYDTVFKIGGGIDAQLERVREHVNDAFVKLFDEALVDANKRLIADPSDRDAKIDFVTTYMMVIEGTLALTGQHTITRSLEERGIMPGFVEGFRHIATDEHRHVAYGTWYLQQAVRRDRSAAERIQAKLAELLPVAAEVLVPPGHSLDEEWELFGVTRSDVHGFAFQALSRRLKVIGLGVPQLV